MKSADQESSEISNPPAPAIDGLAHDRFSGNGAGAADASVSLLARARLLWERRRLVFRFTLSGLLISLLIAFLIPKRYESTARLMPPDDRSTSGLAMLASMSSQVGALGSLAGGLLGVKSSGALFVGVLGSRSVQDRLIERFDLRRVYRTGLMSNAEKQLAENSIISEDRKSGIITITVTDHSPQRAAVLAQAYVEELDRLISQLSTSSAHRERVFLEDRLKTVKGDLDSAAEHFGQFASKNTAIDIQAQGKAMVDAAAQLQGELIAAESQLQGLKQIYTPNNVRIREIEARIGELQRQLDKLGGSSSQAVQNTTSTDDPSYPTIRELPLLGVTYSDLYRRTKIEEAIYETLTQQYELAKVQEAKETPSVKVLDAAQVPDRKAYPSRLLVLLIGTVGSFVIVSLAIFGKASWQKTDPEDPTKKFINEIFEVLMTRIRRILPTRFSSGYRVG